MSAKTPSVAVELLKDASATELGTPTATSAILCPVYVRGFAYLALHDGSRAAGEFQKFFDHRGLCLLFLGERSPVSGLLVPMLSKVREPKPAPVIGIS